MRLDFVSLHSPEKLAHDKSVPDLVQI